MMVVNVRVKDSAIHGLGCFADQPIAKGQLVWTFDDRIDLRIPVERVPGLPQPARDFLDMYAFQEVKDGKTYLILCGDHGKHMNHSEQPNTTEESNGDNRAARDIAAGEELTCNYFLFDAGAAARIGRP